jgi:sporulation protein YqfC
VRDWTITQFDNKKIIVGGVKLLVDFTPDEISVRVGNGIITICGDSLIIERFDENEIIIVGKINGVKSNVKN